MNNPMVSHRGSNHFGSLSFLRKQESKTKVNRIPSGVYPHEKGGGNDKFGEFLFLQKKYLNPKYKIVRFKIGS